MNWKTRLSKYLPYLVLSFFLPFLVMMLCIAITGEREKGMVVGLVVAFMILLILNVFYSFYLFRSSMMTSLCSGVVVTIISLGLTYLGILNDLQLENDRYGIWTILAIYGLSSVLCWELLFQLINRLKAR